MKGCCTDVCASQSIKHTCLKPHMAACVSVLVLMNHLFEVRQLIFRVYDSCIRIGKEKCAMECDKLTWSRKSDCVYYTTAMQSGGPCLCIHCAGQVCCIWFLFARKKIHSLVTILCVVHNWQMNIILVFYWLFSPPSTSNWHNFWLRKLGGGSNFVVHWCCECVSVCMCAYACLHINVG